MFIFTQFIYPFGEFFNQLPDRNNGEIVIKPTIVVPMDRLKGLVKDYDEGFLRELLKTKELSKEEEKGFRSLLLYPCRA